MCLKWQWVSFAMKPMLQGGCRSATGPNGFTTRWKGEGGEGRGFRVGEGGCPGVSKKCLKKRMKNGTPRDGRGGREGKGGGIGPPTGLPKITNIFSVERRSILAHDRMLQNARLSFLSRISALPALAHASFERDTYLSCFFALAGSQRSGWVSVTRDLNALARDRILQTTWLSILRRIVHSRKLGPAGFGR